MKIKKINKKLIAFILLMAITMPFFEDGFNVFANSLTNLLSRSSSLNNNIINILEIQPTDNFVLGNTAIKTGCVELKIDKTNVIVEHMTMAEFIGKVDKINGKYDVIVIGRKTNTSGTDYTFRDYTVLDNDITNRKANEIIDFIKTSQLVYIDSSINSSSSNNNLKNTKLYKKLGEDQNNEIKQYENKNLIRRNVQSSSFNVEKIVEKYNELNKKRTVLEVTEYPQGDSVSRQLKYKFNIESQSNKTENVSVKLYLDINGDGLYKEKEVYKEFDSISLPCTDIEINYTLDKKFIGYLSWKLEVTDSNNIKSYITSSFKVEGGSRTIRVLQVMDGEDNSDTSSTSDLVGIKRYGKLNLEKNTKFSQLIKNTKTEYGYDIQIDSIGSDNFYQEKKSSLWSTDYINVNGVKKQLNGNYDMLIIGFYDYFDTSKINDKAIEEIKKFAESGQGIMLTHDTTYYDGGNLNTNVSNDRHKFTKFLADYIGQSRYENDFNIKEIKEGDAIVETGKDFTGKYIPHDIDKPGSDTSEGIMEQMGATIWKRKNQITKDSVTSNVYKTNDSLITNYPYEIEEEMIVRKTHAQYLQLNLEDEDVVPWINLSGGSINKYDSRNSYYTYSKGNITFSGTGENKRDKDEFPDDEFRLFINTIIKAERGANHAPEIESSIDDEVNKEIPINQKYTFKVTANDLDNDKIDVTVKINGVTVENIKGKTISSGELIDVDITPTNEDKITVTVEAKDENNAEAQSKTYIFNPTMEAQVQCSDAEVTGLVGDEIKATINISKSYDNKNQIKSLSIEKIEYDSNDIDVNAEKDNINFNENKAQAIFTLKLKEKVENEKIKITFKYNLNGSERYAVATIYYKCREGVINIEVVDADGNILRYSDIKSIVEENSNYSILSKLFNRSVPFKGVEAYLRKDNNTINHIGINESTGKAEFRQVKSGTYEVDISKIDGFDALCDDKNVNLNYENNEQTRIFTVSLNSENKVMLKVKDSSGYIDKTYDSTKNSSDYNIKYDYDNFDEVYKLYGRSSAEVNFYGDAFNYLEYRFVNSDNEEGTTEWVGMNSNSDIVNRPGYLTQMPYNVSSLPTLSNNSIWSKRDEVFKEIFESDTSEISMEVFRGGNQSNPYVTQVKEDGKFVRWKPETFFVQNHNVGAYAYDYKEARKAWGYIKVPESGNYNFRTISDDGVCVKITVNGITKVVAEDFRPRGASNIDSTESIYLEKDKYYPIYIEYFNWGGSAALEIKYKKDGKGNYENIPANWFYPSNSKNPIQGGNNTFTGAQNVNFPEITGTYTIEYRVGIKNNESDNFNILKTGSFGEFEVENRFDLEKSTDVGEVSIGENFNINYILSPKTITLRDLYKISGDELKNKNNIPQTLTIKGVALSDILPQGLEYINKTEMDKVRDVTYTLNKTGEKSEWKYEADPLTISVSVKSNSVQNITFANKSGYINYGDVTLDTNLGYLWKKDYFNGCELNIIDSSKITAHGEYKNNSTIGNSSMNVMKNMYYSLGVSLDIKNTSNILKINFEQINTKNGTRVFVYKCDENGNIQSLDNNIVTTITNGGDIEVKNFTQGKYIVVYNIKIVINGTSSANAGIAKANLVTSNGSIIDNKNATLNIQSDKLPELF